MLATGGCVSPIELEHLLDPRGWMVGGTTNPNLLTTRRPIGSTYFVETLFRAARIRYGFIVSRHPYPIGYLANAEQALDGFNFGRLRNAAGGVRFAGCCCTGEDGHGVAIAGLADRVAGRRGDGLGSAGQAGRLRRRPQLRQPCGPA